MKLQREQRETIWRGALFLSIAAIVTKILSAAYRIPYQNIAGDIGFYIYQQVYPFYGIALILSVYGFPVVISKFVSETNSKEKLQQVMAISFYSLLLFSVGSSLTMFALASSIARLMGDIHLTLPLQVTALSFLMIPFLSVFRGYYQGKGMMGPTAVSQVWEQFARVCFILLFAYLLLQWGYGPYGAGAGAAIGSVIGALVGIMVLFVYFIKSQSLSLFRSSLRLVEAKYIIVRLLKESILICFSSLVFVLFQLVDALTIIRLLQEAGINETIAKVSKGVYDRGQPLLQLGTVVSIAVSLAIVPLIAHEVAARNNKKANAYAELAIRFSFIIGLSAAVGLAIIIGPTNAMLFTDRADSHVLAVLGMSILFSSVVMTTAAILQGYGDVKSPALHVCIGFFIKLLLNMLLIPAFGTLGAAVATVFAFAVVCFLNLRKVVQKQVWKHYIKRYRAVLYAVVVMAVVTYSWLILAERFVTVQGRFGDTIVSLTSAVVGAVVLLPFLMRFGAFDSTELQTFAKGERLQKWMKYFLNKN